MFVAYFKYLILHESWLSLVLSRRLRRGKHALRPGRHPEPQTSWLAGQRWVVGFVWAILLPSYETVTVIGCGTKLCLKALSEGGCLCGTKAEVSDRNAKVSVKEVGPPTSSGDSKLLDQISSALLLKFYPWASWSDPQHGRLKFFQIFLCQRQTILFSPDQYLIIYDD